MIQHEIEAWFGRLADWRPALRGTERHCELCHASLVGGAAGLTADDPHEVRHWLIASIEHFTVELEEDLIAEAEYGASEDELRHQAWLSVRAVLVEKAPFIRRALELYVTPKVDAFVAESVRSIDFSSGSA